MTKICSVDGCGRKNYAKGWCSAHYFRVRQTGDLQPDAPILERRARMGGLCTIEGCEERHHCKGFCIPHYERFRTYGDPLHEAPKRPTVCCVEGCARPTVRGCRDYCRPHYDRILKYGDPRADVPVKIFRNDEARFWSYVEKNGPDECWLWVGLVNPQGYGRFRIGRSTPYAHRHAYEILVGPIPDGLTLDHLCRVPLCVNPAHLEPVTLGENARRAAKARREERQAAASVK